MRVISKIIIIAVIIGIIISLLYITAEIGKLVELLSEGESHCEILKRNGATENEFLQCQLDFVREARQGCAIFGFVLPPTCDGLESYIDEQDLRRFLP